MSFTHVENVMGTAVGFSSPEPLPPAGVAAAVALLHDADRVFSTWRSDSPLSRLRSGSAALYELADEDRDQVYEVFGRCSQARLATGGAFDPWAMPGGVDPTGLVKGWAAQRALRALVAEGAENVMVNAGGDIAVAGLCEGARWRVGIRDPFAPDRLARIVEVERAIATSGDYERPGQLFDPASGRVAREVASATVIGPELDFADALATALAVRGESLLPAIAGLAGYDAYLITQEGAHHATAGMPFLPT